MNTLWQDIRYAMRVIAKSPGFSIVAVITLALGVGANTAIFSVVNAVLLRSLPFKDPDSLAVIWANNTREGKPRYPISPANFVDLRDQNQSFEQIAAYSTFNPTSTLTGIGEPKSVIQSMVSTNLFDVLGVTASLGRTFVPEEAQIGHDRVALLSYAFWQRHLGGDSGIVGQALTFSGTPYTVIGVMPQGFYFLNHDTDVWVPLSFNPQIHPSLAITNRAGGGFGIIGRMKPGVNLEQASSEMQGLARRLEEQYPEANSGIGATLIPLHQQVTSEIRPALLVLFGAVGLVLLIACANVATLLLARAKTRAREIAVRAALGATRARLIRQLLTESVLLAFTGGLAGLAVASFGIQFLLSLSPAEIPRRDEIGIDFWVLTFTLGLSIFTGVIFGIAPALQASRPDLNESLKEGGRSAGLGRHRLQRTLVVAEIALTLVLLVGAGLLIRSFARLMDTDPGFKVNNLLTMNLAAPPSRATSAPQLAAYYQELFSRIESLPGVQSVGTVTRLPLSARGGVTTFMRIEGNPVPENERPEMEFRRASANYFTAMGIPLVNGRFFNEQDNLQSTPVFIINETAARRFWPGEDPVGKRINTSPNPAAPFYPIVGVVGDIKHFGLDSDPRPEVYIASEQAPPSAPIMVVRTTSDPANIAAAVRAQVQAISPDVPIDTPLLMNEVVSASVAGRRFNMLLLGIFAVLATVLAGVGLYGVMSYMVTQRTPEIGIRMALGAEKSHVLRLIVGHVFVLTAAGIGIGLVAAFGLTQLMSSLIFGISATDPIAFGVVSLLLMAVSLLAGYLPARRAIKIDPIVALRHE
jgi:putative ABC transport system permease protein